MKRLIFISFLLSCSIGAYSQKTTEKQDSIQVSLRKSLDSLLKHTPNKLNRIVLKKILKDITPKAVEKPSEGWEKKGKFSLFFNQSAFNYDWQGGGTSNVAGNSALRYEFSYKRKNFTWDTWILADYGLTFLRGENFSRKTNDRIEFNSRIGQRIRQSFWNYSLFVNFRSQFARGYRFSKDPNSDRTIRTEETHFFSPAFIQIGPGLLWKKNDNLHMNIAPVTSRMIFVDDQFTSEPDYIDGEYFGVGVGKRSRFEFGGSLSGYAKFNVVKNITVEQVLNLYTNYIENPYNVDIDYILNINLIVNEYISGNLVFQAIYDDNATSGFQVREVIGLGLNYKL